MSLQTEQIGSIPRPDELVSAWAAHSSGTLSDDDLAAVSEAALRDTITRLEATGSPVVTDGEQTRSSFVTYPLEGSDQLAADGITLPFTDGHTRQLPRLVSGPFRYTGHADRYLRAAQRHATVSVKQAVIAPSALSLLYPAEDLPDYSREEFLNDLIDQAEADVRGCLDAGAHVVQLDFSEGRLSVKLDPSKGLLRSFVDLNNRLLERFSAEERARIGVHTCPGGDQDSTHSLDVDYAELLPRPVPAPGGTGLHPARQRGRPAPRAGDRRQSSRSGPAAVRRRHRPHRPQGGDPELVRDRLLLAAEYIAPDRLGSCDDCGFSPFADDGSTSRELAFAKITARVEGTALASEMPRPLNERQRERTLLRAASSSGAALQLVRSALVPAAAKCGWAAGARSE